MVMNKSRDTVTSYLDQGRNAVNRRDTKDPVAMGLASVFGILLRLPIFDASSRDKGRSPHQGEGIDRA